MAESIEKRIEQIETRLQRIEERLNIEPVVELEPVDAPWPTAPVAESVAPIAMPDAAMTASVAPMSMPVAPSATPNAPTATSVAPSSRESTSHGRERLPADRSPCRQTRIATSTSGARHRLSMHALRTSSNSGNRPHPKSAIPTPKSKIPPSPFFPTSLQHLRARKSRALSNRPSA